MPEQQMNEAPVDPDFQEMRSKNVPQEMGINGLGELGGVAGFFADEGDAIAGDRFGDAVARKEPGLQLIELPVAPQQRQEIGGEHDEAIALDLALAHPDDHALGVDVCSGSLPI